MAGLASLDSAAENGNGVAEITAISSTLAESFLLCSLRRMERPDRSNLATILLAAPAWARVGLNVRDPRLRERAADALAATIVERLDPPAEPDPRQIALPL